MSYWRKTDLLFVAAAVLSMYSTAFAQKAAPSDAKWSGALATASEPGTRLTVSGRVLDSDDKPVSNASIYVYQTDAAGEYVKGARGGGSDRPRLFAFLRSDSQGRYQFTTIRPGSYPETRNPGHIHFEVMTPSASRIYEIVFANDPFITEPFRAQARLPYGNVVIVETRSADGGLAVTHDIRLKTK